MTKRLGSALVLATAVMGTVLPVAAEVESTEPIKLTLHDWTGQLITTNLMAEVLKKAGYNVDLVQADYIAQFAGLKTGDLHVAMEIWETTGRDAMDEATLKTRSYSGVIHRLSVARFSQRLNKHLVDA